MNLSPSRCFNLTTGLNDPVLRIAAAIAAALAWAFPVLAQDSIQEQAPVVSVQVVAHAADLRQHVTIGTARAAQSTALMPDAEGRIAEILVVSGQVVGTGQALMRLDSEQEELALRQAKLRLRAATLVFDRYVALDNKGAVPAAQLETAEIDLDAARIAVEEAELALSRRYLTAPFDGTLGLIDLYPGAHVTTATAITQLDDMSTLLVDFAMPESTVGSLVKDQEVPITSMVVGGMIMARVEVASHRVDPQSRTYDVRARIDSPLPWMTPGMSFRIAVTTETGTYPVIPEAAILWGSRGAYVWHVAGGLAQRLPVTVVRRRDGRVWVDADLAPGDIIVSEGVQKVREGDPITAQPKSALTPQSADQFELTSND